MRNDGKGPAPGEFRSTVFHGDKNRGENRRADYSAGGNRPCPALKAKTAAPRSAAVPENRKRGRIRAAPRSRPAGLSGPDPR
jgi:hypothetical protein